MNRILMYLNDMLPYIFLFLPAFAVFRFVRIKQMNRSMIKTTFLHEAGITVLSFIIVGLISQAVLAEISFTGSEFVVNADDMNNIRLNLTPFRFIGETYRMVTIYGDWNYLLINFFGNIGIFMPFGIFIPLLFRTGKSFVKVTLIGFAVSVFIELCQLPLMRGTDIDDVILNTLGAILGYFVFLLIEKAMPRFAEKFKVKNIEKK